MLGEDHGGLESMARTDIKGPVVISGKKLPKCLVSSEIHHDTYILYLADGTSIYFTTISTYLIRLLCISNVSAR